MKFNSVILSVDSYLSIVNYYFGIYINLIKIDNNYRKEWHTCIFIIIHKGIKTETIIPYLNLILLLFYF